MEERMDRRIAQLALDRFRVDGFVGTSIADLAGALGVSKAAIYYHYQSKDALLHHLVDPLLDAIDACIQDHNQPPRPPPQTQPPQSLLTAPDTSVAARLRAEAALGAIWRPLIAEPPLDLTSP